MAHRVAIQYPTSTGMSDGVFIWRRETDQCLVSRLGGRLFPGVHQSGEFTVDDRADGLSIAVRTRNGEADVRVEASYGDEWNSQSVFSGLDDAADFFRRGDCGFSCSLRDGTLDGIQLKTLRWEMSSLRIHESYSAFFQGGQHFPANAVEFDCALLMRGIPHEWHEISDVPELAAAIQK